jgi:hypothetical protein
MRWRRHVIRDEQFPIWYGDGSRGEPIGCEVHLRRTIEDFTLAEPTRADVALPIFRLSQVKSAGLRKWLTLYEDPIFARAIEPAVEVINGMTRFLEPRMMMMTIALDSMGYYRDPARRRNAKLQTQVERCLDAANIDVPGIGSRSGIALAIARVNNDLKHPDRLSRPDPRELSLITEIATAIMRQQIVDLVGLQPKQISTNSFNWVSGHFRANSATIDDDGHVIFSGSA